MGRHCWWSRKADPWRHFRKFRTPLLQSQFHANPRKVTLAVLPFRSRILEVKLHRSILVQMNGHSILIQQVRQMFFSNQSGKFMYLTHLMSSTCFYTPCYQLEKSSLTKVCDRLSMWQLETQLFLPLLIFNWCLFSVRVAARWWRQWAKNQVLTNQNLRNRWCQIVRRTICEY